MECKWFTARVPNSYGVWFNRYIVECKSKTVTAYNKLETDLIDT